MKKRKILITFLLLVPVIVAGRLCLAEEEMKSLAANRSLLARAKAEYAQAETKLKTNPSETLRRKLANLKYRIQALNEDRSRLLSALPKEKQANELIKDLMMKNISIELPAEEEPLPEIEKEVEKKDAPPPSIEQMHEMALAYVDQLKYREALKLYEEIVLLTPEDDQAYIIMGHLYLMAGRYDKAEAAFHNAVSIDPENVRDIAPFYENIILENPGDDSAYANLGYAYLILGDFLKAKDAFKNALSINPHNQTAMRGIQIAETQ